MEQIYVVRLQDLERSKRNLHQVGYSGLPKALEAVNRAMHELGWKRVRLSPRSEAK